MNNPASQSMQQEERRKANALTISLISGIVFTIVAAVAGYVGYSDNGVRGLFGFGITGTVAIAAFISTFLCRRGRSSQGISVLIGTIFLLALTIPFIVHGQGLALGILVAIVVAGISSATLPTASATRAIIGGFTIAIIITITDLYLPDLGLPTDATTANTIAGVTALLYLITILWRYNTYALRTKIVIAFILVTIIPLVALGFFNSWSSAQSLQAQNKIQLSSLAHVVANTVDGFITVQLDSIHTDSRQSALSSYLELPRQERAGSEAERNARQMLTSLTRRDPIFIHSIALLDKNGLNILDTFEEQRGRNEGLQAYFKRPLQTGLAYASNIVFQDKEAFIYISSPVKTQDNVTLGVLRVEYYATVLQSIVRSVDPGNSGTIILLADTKTYLRTAYTGDRTELFTSFKNFNDLELNVMQLEGRIPSLPRDQILKGTNDVIVAGLDKLQQTPFFNAYSGSLGSDTINTGVLLETQPWVAVIRQSTKIYLAPIAEQYRTNILISMALVVFSIIAGFFASQILTSPLLSLAKVAEKITAGDLSARAQTTTEDEIGALSVTFNRMTDELNQTVNSLESRVTERTTDLEIARQQSEKRANELQSVGEISKIITSEQKLETLLPLITRLVSESFGFYHTGIFLINETRQFAVLEAANSDGGKNMLARGHKLEVGATGIVGYVAKFGTTRIALDVGLDAVYFNNPDLPNTRSEMALPLKVRDQIVGVLDVQSEKPGVFNENNANTLGILADQIAIAIENARLFTQTQQALLEAQALYRQNIQEKWLSFSHDEASIGYHQTLTGGKKINTPVDTDEIRQAMNRGSTMVFQAGETKQDPAIVVPIKLRGQVIGALNIKAPTQDRRWTNDEINLVEAISERLSLALENARLFEETSTRATRERLVSDITTRIRSTNDPQEMIQTAVEELQRVLGATRIEIVPKNNTSASDK
jgi:GAF domain-containing protein/HAMP domain-containing protein